MIDEKSVKMITERHRRVQGFLDGLPGTLIHWQRLEAVGINSGSCSHFLVFNKFLLDPGESKLCITVVILKPVPAHHIQDVEDTIALAIDAVEYGVGVPPVLIPVPSRQVAWKTFNLLPTFAKHLGGPISGNHEVPATLHRHFIFISFESDGQTSGQRISNHFSARSTGTSTSHSDSINWFL